MHSEDIKLITSINSSSLETVNFNNGRVESICFKHDESKMSDILGVDTSAIDDLVRQAQKEAEYNKRLFLQNREYENCKLVPFGNKSLLKLIAATSKLIEQIKKH